LVGSEKRLLSGNKRFMNKHFIKKRFLKKRIQANQRISLTTLLHFITKKKMLSKIFVFLAMIFASVLADRMYDEKFSQPMSEKDMTLGNSVYPVYFICSDVFDSQVKHHFWWTIYLCHP
jgi:hypothetical protein